MNKFILLIPIIYSFTLQSAQMSLKEEQEYLANQEQINLPKQPNTSANIQVFINKNKFEAIAYLKNELTRINQIKSNLISQDLDFKKQIVHELKIRNYIKEIESVIKLIIDDQFKNALDVLRELENEYPEEVEFKESKIRLNNIIKFFAKYLSTAIEESSPAKNTLNLVLEKIKNPSMYEKFTNLVYSGEYKEKKYLRDKLLPLAIELIKANKKAQAIELLNEINGLKLINDSIKLEINNAIQVLLNNESFVFPTDLSEIINSYLKPWSPDEKLAFSTAQNDIKILIKILDANTGKQLKVFKLKSNLLSMAWAPNGNNLAIGLMNNKLEIWDANKGKLVKTFNIAEKLFGVFSIRELAWSPDGLKIALSSSKKIIIWDLNTEDLLENFDLNYVNYLNYPQTISLNWSNYGINFAVNVINVASPFNGFSNIKIWNSSNPEQIKNLVVPVRIIRSLAFSPDGSKLAILSMDKSISIVDLDKDKQLKVLDVEHENISISWSSSGNKLFSVTTDGIVIVWERKNYD